jgi:multicomponent Na+:H+ antiporter subunit D
MLITHLPVLQVVAPLIAAPVCLLLSRPRHAWVFTLFVTSCVFAIALLILQQVHTGNTLSYALGAWGAPWGIEYRIDMLSALLVLIIATIGLVVMLYARTSVGREIAAHSTGRFYASFLLCLTGLLGIVVTGDAFNLFVFLEISSLSCYVLISLGPTRRALTAAFQYLVMGTIGATFILIGVGLLYMMTGTLDMVDLAVRLQDVTDTRTIRVAFAFITVGVSLKLALFPLHLWLPNAYALGRHLCTAALFLYGVWRAFLIRDNECRRYPPGTGGRRHAGCITGRRLPGKYQTHAGVLESCSYRLHRAWYQPCEQCGPYRRDAAYL